MCIKFTLLFLNRALWMPVSWPVKEHWSTGTLEHCDFKGTCTKYFLNEKRYIS